MSTLRLFRYNNNNNNNKSGFTEPSSNQTALKTVQRRKEKGQEIREKYIYVCKKDLKTLNIYVRASHTHT